MHFYNIATNLTNGPFMIGYEDEADNFYLKGEAVADNPEVSCRIFNSKGEHLFSMTRNAITHHGGARLYMETDPGKLLVVKDHEGNFLIRLETREEGGRRVTYVQGSFFDKHGKLAARGDERGLLVNCPLRM